MFGKSLSGLLAAVAIAAASPALAAAPVTDCPNRDAPFSASAPLIDVLLSDRARGVLEQTMPGEMAKIPAFFTGTTPPTFSAILSLKDAGSFLGIKAEAIAAADAALRTLPVNEADKAARCARFDNDVPVFTPMKGKVKVLVFEKINGFKDTPSVNAAHAAMQAMAARKGWAVQFTNKGGAFNPQTLKAFNVIVWNNNSGEVLTLSQRAAFKNWLEAGGAFVGIHGAAGDPVYFWDWYPDTLIGARFAGHPRDPQFQEARVEVNTAHPLAKGLPSEWRMTEEWYSFKSNPRLAGATPVLLLDESTYRPDDPQAPGLVMGKDHPLAWTNCIGKGRVFYSAIGHRPENYEEPNHVRLLENAIFWAATDRKACVAPKR